MAILSAEMMSQETIDAHEIEMALALGKTSGAVQVFQYGSSITAHPCSAPGSAMATRGPAFFHSSPESVPTLPKQRCLGILSS